MLAQAGQDLLIKGSNVVSDDGTTLIATRDVKVENALDTSRFYENKQQVTKGLMGGGIGFTVGTRDQRAGHQADSQTVVGATVGSVNGDVNVVAGREFAQTGSVIQTPKGDVDVLAQKISIQGAAQQGKDVQTTAFRQSGLTVAVSAPLLSALQSTKDMAENVGKVGDARMQALGVAATAIKAKEAAQALQADPKAAGGLSVSITVGSSQSKSRTETTTTTNQGSEVTAGGDIRLTAQGAGKDSSLSVQGSDLAAAQRLALKAEGDVSLTSSQDLVVQKSANSSSSAAVGVAISVGSGGASMGFTASASLARGKSDGEDVIQRNTHVQGKEVSIESGGDTTLKGAVVSGDKVKATVGGDLNVESLQDTSRFRSESMQAGGSMTVGAGFSGSVSYGQSKVKSDYASVTEQSGIRAGDGGFQVEVKGSTDLKGGSITSTQAAIDAGANSFKSGSLTMSDIENKADYKGSSFSVSAGFGKKDGSEKNEGGEEPKDGSYQLMTMKPGDPGQSAGMGYASDKASSTTKAGISGVAGNVEARTGDAESGIKQIFDKEKVQQDLTAQVAITQTFGKEAAKQIGAFADTKLTEAIDLRKKADAEPDQAKRDALIAQATDLEKNWGADGTLRVAAHAALGGLTGNLSGAVGAAAGTLTAPQVKDALEQAGLNAGLVDGLTRLASTTVGGLAGGSLAGAGAAFNEVSNNYLKHQQVLDMLDKLKKAKTNDARDAVFREYAQLSQKQSAEIANCRGAACDQIAKDIEEGKQTLKANGAEIDKFAGVANLDRQNIRDLQFKDANFVETQKAFNAVAKDRAKTFEAMKLSPQLRSVIEFSEACTTAACAQAQYEKLNAMKASATGQDRQAIALEVGYLQGRISAFGACLKGTGCEGIVMAGNVLVGLKSADGLTGKSGSKAVGEAEQVPSKAMVDVPENYHETKTSPKPTPKPVETPKQLETSSPVESVKPAPISKVGDLPEALDAPPIQAPGTAETSAPVSKPAVCVTGSECFVAGTLIHTKDGLRPIEQLRVGEFVFSRDEHTLEPGLRPIVGTKSTPAQPVHRIVVRGEIGEEHLVTTSDHPFWVLNKEGGAGWIRAADLSPEAVLFDVNGAEVKVVYAASTGELRDVFNIEVHEHHTYHVGHIGTFVHNAACCGGQGPDVPPSPPKIGAVEQPAPAEKLPAGYLAKPDGVYVGPNGGVLVKVGETEAGQPVFQRSSGEYIKVDEATGTQVPVRRGDADSGVKWDKTHDAGAQIAQNYENGVKFRTDVISGMGLDRNTQLREVDLGGGKIVKTIPDATGKPNRIVEIKNEIDISMTDQFRAQLKYAEDSGSTYTLIVSPRTKNISETLWNDIVAIEGKIYVYDPSSGQPPKLLEERPKK